MAMLGLRCCMDFSLVEAGGGYSLDAVHGLLVVVSLVVAQGLISCGSQALENRLIVPVHGLSCSRVYGIFLDQGFSLCLLHWQEDS